MITVVHLSRTLKEEGFLDLLGNLCSMEMRERKG
jgi:hypothetical protein